MPIVEDLPDDLRTNQALVGAWGRFAGHHRDVGERIAAKLAGSGDRFPIRLADGELVGEVSAAEFADRYAKVSWSILSFETGNDGLGATVNRFEGRGSAKRWAGADARILPEGLLAFDAHGANGLVYLALHETAHTTALGIATNEDCWKQHLAHTRHIPWGQTNPWWLRNEKTANNIMRNVAKRLALPFLADPGAQFDAEGGGDEDLLLLDAISLLEGAGHGGSQEKDQSEPAPD